MKRNAANKDDSFMLFVFLSENKTRTRISAICNIYIYDDL